MFTELSLNFTHKYFNYMLKCFERVSGMKFESHWVENTVWMCKQEILSFLVGITLGKLTSKKTRAT
jgi:hypothetical protein